MAIEEPGVLWRDGVYFYAASNYTSQQKLDTKNKIFFRFNPKFGQLRIVHDTVVVLSTLSSSLQLFEAQ
ncbi:MAG: hypothetical protein Q4F89_01655 [Mitsuokella multacida]|nr:hypothetical protein [Mitsuokella multacida]